MAGEIVVAAPQATRRALGLVSAAHDATGDGVPGQAAGRWIYGFTYGPENYTTGVTLDTCDGGKVDQPALPTPTGVVATPSTTGGTLAAGVKSYRVAALRGSTTTVASTAATATTTGATSSVVVTWPAVYGADSYNVYGRASGTELLMASTTALTFTDTAAVTPAGALPASNTTGGTGDYLNAATVAFTPYGIRAEDRCSTLGFEARDYIGRATRQLEAVTGKQVEKEFWAGAQTQASATGNQYLTDGTAVDVTATPGTAMTRQAGFEALEEALAGCGYGPRGMIHCQPQVLPSPNQFALRREGNMLLSNLDTVVVPGVGYPGTSPAGATPTAGTTWIYATPLVDVRLSAPILVPDPAADGDWRFQALDRERDDIVIRAMRFAAATHDGPCKFAALITTTT